MPARVVGLASGALLVMGLLQALFNWIGSKIEEYKRIKNTSNKEPELTDSNKVEEAGERA